MKPTKATEIMDSMIDALPAALTKEMKFLIAPSFHKKLSKELNRKVRTYKGLPVQSKSDTPMDKIYLMQQTNKEK